MNRREFVTSTLTLCGRLVLPAGILTTAGCAQNRDTKLRTINGRTMGTYYRINVDADIETSEVTALRAGIEAVFERVIDGMSTYEPDSILSRVNNARNTKWQAVNEDLLQVLREAHRISALTGGAFDASVGPLVNLWGFGAHSEGPSIPDPDRVASARARTGHHLIALAATPARIRKDHPEAYLDLSAIAKGYAVDEVGRFLERRGIHRYLVDVGGELRAGDAKPGGVPWRIGIETPNPANRGVERILDVTGIGIATSGDYRNFFERDGRRYSHTLDPRTGKPVAHNLASVTVLDKSVMSADALATGLMVLGPEAGYEFAERHAIPALFMSRVRDGLAQRHTSTLAPHLAS